MATPAGALPQLQQAFSAFVAALAARGIIAHIPDFGGVRTQADTTTILDDRLADYNHDNGLPLNTPQSTDILNAYRPIAPYGLSFHNYGAAFDLLMPSDDYAIAGDMAPQFGLRWGGLFSNPDPRHFELDISLADAQSQYALMTGGQQLDPNVTPFAIFGGINAGTLPNTVAYDSGDDSGEAAGFMDDAGAAQVDQQIYRQLGFAALAGVALGVVVWAVRRKFLPNEPRLRYFAFEGGD